MTHYRLRSLFEKLGYISILNAAGILTFVATAEAQNAITPDDTLGAESSVVVPFNTDTDIITRGATRGQNLFHSFEEFSIGEGNGAYFITETDAIANIFARITGGEVSNIQGVLGTRQAVGEDFVQTDADLFLINPNGVIFGENAVLDVGGSFTATTASGVNFGSTGSFSAVEPDAPPSILTVNPSVYFFNQLSPGAIVSRSTRFDLIDGANRGLRVPNGENLTLLGGDITIDGGNVAGGLSAQGGRVETGAVSGPGSVSLNTDGSLTFPATLSKGNLSVRNARLLSVLIDDAGDIALTADNVLLNNSQLFSGTVGTFGTIGEQAGDIVIQATGDIRIDQSRIISNVGLNANSTGGDIRIAANNFELLNGSAIAGTISGSGTAGNIIITLSGMARFEGVNPNTGQPSDVVSWVLPNAEGTGGNVQLTAASLELTDRASLSASNFGTGDAGDVVLAIAEIARFSSNSAVSSDALGEGNAGTIRITATNLEMTDESVLSTATADKGDGGNILLDVQQTARFESGSSANSIVFDEALEFLVRGEGTAGTIQITANNLEVNTGAFLSTSNFGTGNAGSVILTVQETARFEDLSISEDSSSAVFSLIGSSGKGTGGDVQITATNLEILDGAVLSTENLGLGDAGVIAINVQNQLTADDGTITTSSVLDSGGQVDITAGSVVLSNDSDILTFVNSGGGDGGDIIIVSDFLLALDDSDILAFSADGEGGNIDLSQTAFLSQNPNFASGDLSEAELFALDGNDQVDVNPTGGLRSGQISVGDISFIENSINELSGEIVNTETLTAGSCIARTEDDQGTFTITGGDGLPARPGTIAAASFQTGTVRGISDTAQAIGAENPPLSEAIVEPTGIYELTDGRVVLSHRCEEGEEWRVEE